MDCKTELREALIQALSEDRTRKAPQTLAELRAASKNQPAYGVAVRVLDLPKPVEGKPLLQEMLNDENELVAIQAAATLALLDSQDGIERLKATKTASNSQIEFFIAKAALLILNQKIPPTLAKRASVFQSLEELIRRCARSLPGNLLEITDQHYIERFFAIPNVEIPSAWEDDILQHQAELLKLLKEKSLTKNDTFKSLVAFNRPSSVTKEGKYFIILISLEKKKVLRLEGDDIWLITKGKKTFTDDQRKVLQDLLP